MNILVLNGSPKGASSITLQTILYLQKKFPTHTFRVLSVGQKIRSLEKDLSPALRAMEQADLLLFSYPVYTFLAPSQLHRFIALVKASDVDLRGKFATQLTTSKHFYDVTAHEYIRENCQDLGLKYIRGLSADMEDLLHAQGRKDAEAFFRYICWAMAHDQYEQPPEVCPLPRLKSTSLPPEPAPAHTGDIVVLTDCQEDDVSLQQMIQRFCRVIPRKTRVVNLRDCTIKGGCLGCMLCAASGKCVYRDGFDDVIRHTIQSGEAIVYAFTIRDHSMGPLFKCYDDRQFCNGHRTVTMGTPVAYLINGAYSRETNLQTVIEARAQVGGNFLAHVATNERDPDGEIDRLAEKLSYALDHGYSPPSNFYGVGGMKIFRDLIWLMQGFMKADHRFYKAHGQYDFPQKKCGTMAKMYLVGALFSSPALRAKAGPQLKEGMLAPYRKVLDRIK